MVIKVTAVGKWGKGASNVQCRKKRRDGKERWERKFYEAEKVGWQYQRGVGGGGANNGPGRGRSVITPGQAASLKPEKGGEEEENLLNGEWRKDQKGTARGARCRSLSATYYLRVKGANKRPWVRRSGLKRTRRGTTMTNRNWC